MQTYARVRIHYVSEPPIGVAFRFASTRSDGSPSDAQWFDHATGGRDNAFDPSRHVRRLDADPDRQARQSYAVPSDVCDDPSAVAYTFVLSSDGSILSDHDALSANQLYSLVRGWSSKP